MINLQININIELHPDFPKIIQKYEDKLKVNEINNMKSWNFNQEKNSDNDSR